MSPTGPTILRDWIAPAATKTVYIEPGSPRENGYVEFFNGKPRDELLYGEILYTLAEAKIVIEQRRRYYNTVRPHSPLGYWPPAPEVASCPALPDSFPVARLAVPSQVETRSLD